MEYFGDIYTWTEIDKTQPFLDTALLRETDPEQLAKINIPDNIGFNGQRFYYLLRLIDHILVFESKNEEGRSLAPSSAEKIFKKLFDPEVLSSIKFDLARPDYVEVDLVVEEEALDKIYSIPHLSSLSIFISVPNSDDNTVDAEKIIENLEKIKARSKFTNYKAANNSEGIKPDEKLKTEAKAALTHGFVQGDGRDDAGKKISLSTKSYPRQASAFIDIYSLSIDTAIQVTKEFIARVRPS